MNMVNGRHGTFNKHNKMGIFWNFFFCIGVALTETALCEYCGIHIGGSHLALDDMSVTAFL